MLLVFFKGRDDNVILEVFRGASAKNMEKEKKPSIRERPDEAKWEYTDRKTLDRLTSQNKPSEMGDLMVRSKKCSLEWSFFRGENSRHQYSKLYKGCVYPCKQSSRAMVVSCLYYLSLRSQKRGN